MSISKPRRLAIALSAVAATVMLGAATAGAAVAPTMPAANPIDYKQMNTAGAAQVFAYTIDGEDLGGAAMSDTVDNGLMGGMGATITVSKAVYKGYTTYQTVTVRPTKTGQVTSTIANAFATLSRGNFGTGTIASTALKANGRAYTVKLRLAQDGAIPDLNLRFYLYKS